MNEIKNENRSCEYYYIDFYATQHFLRLDFKNVCSYNKVKR
ncbi:hypothetical protein [Listeria phage vB_Lmo_C2]